MVSRAADDGRYWYFFAVSDVAVGTWFLQWDHVFVLLAAVLLDALARRGSTATT